MSSWGGLGCSAHQRPRAHQLTASQASSLTGVHLSSMENLLLAMAIPEIPGTEGSCSSRGPLRTCCLWKNTSGSAGRLNNPQDGRYWVKVTRFTLCLKIGDRNLHSVAEAGDKHQCKGALPPEVAVRAARPGPVAVFTAAGGFVQGCKLTW